MFSGTLVTAGQGIAEIAATGFRSELGKIGKALQQVEPEPTLLQKETGRLVRTFAIVGLLACALVVVVFAFTRGGGADVWKQGFLAGIAMAMATLPEEFPVVLTVFLALGAWRISRSHVLTRRMPAVETLGAATVLCVDKTGTLTQNQMTLRQVAVAGSALDLTTLRGTLPDELHGLLENAVLASKRDPFDPMERALHEAGDRLLKDTEHLHPGWSLVREYPLTPDLLAVSHAWRTGNGDEVVVAAKGAPEAIADLCHLGPSPLESHVARGCGPGVPGPSSARRRAGSHPRGQSSRRAPRSVPRTRRPAGLRGSAAANGAGCGGRVPDRRRARGDDHGRLSGDRPEHRPPGGPRQLRDGDHRGPNSTGCRTRTWRAGSPTCRCSPAWFPSRSCASSTR